MTIALSLKEFWQDLTVKPTANANPAEKIIQFPQQLGQGYNYHISLRPELSLTIRQYQLRDCVIINNHPREHPIEFGFKWSGKVQDEYGNYFQGSQNVLVGGVEPGGKVNWESQQPISNLSIHIEPELLQSWINPEFDALPTPLQSCLTGKSEKSHYFCVGENTPAMQAALSQILNCPYQGITKQIYLESKVLELITLKLDQLLASHRDSVPLSNLTLTREDIEIIYEAKDILLNNIQNPPSLMELARKAGLNDRKLKQGFRQVFGTTVFGYLHDYRLEQARFLLEDPDIAIAQVAKQVGYSNLSAFSTAFRKKYGINPRAYAQSPNLVKKSL